MVLLVWILDFISKLYMPIIFVIVVAVLFYKVYFSSHSTDREEKEEDKIKKGYGRSGSDRRKSSETSRDIDTKSAIMRILGYIARGNPAVTPRENASADNVINRLDPRYNTILKYAYGTGCSYGYDPHVDIDIILRAYSGDHDAYVKVVSFMVFMALADNKIIPEEEKRVKEIANALFVTVEEVDALIREMKSYTFEEASRKPDEEKSREFYSHSFHDYSYTYTGRNQRDEFGGRKRKSAESEGIYEDALRLLGVTENSTAGEVSRAYRRLIKKYHPDLIKAKGLPEDMVSVYEEKTKEINQAYDIVKKRRVF